MNNISSCRSPQQMFGAVIKEYFKKTDKAEERETVVISIMPCTSKKFEASRPENMTDGMQDVDTVITTQELAAMIREAGIVFDELEPEALDMPLGLSSGAGVMFGVTGGVAEAVIRRCLIEKTSESLREISFKGIRGMDGIKEAAFEIEGRTFNFAVVHGLKNVEMLIEMIKSGEKSYDFVEVMACQGGCVGGAGQPIPKDNRTRNRRAKGIYNADSISQIKRSEENPMVIALYNGLLKGKHHLLHNAPKE
jgi:NADH-quinone oxidoreductase subunit G